MRVFLDTNILVDVAENRQGAAQAAAILQLGEEGHIDLCASYLSYANMGYIWRNVPRHKRYERIRNACTGIEVLPMDASQLYNGLQQEVKDYEDMLQYQCAIAAGCDVIITNNTRDYREYCTLPFMSSRDFLLQYFQSHCSRPSRLFRKGGHKLENSVRARPYHLLTKT